MTALDDALRIARGLARLARGVILEMMARGGSAPNDKECSESIRAIRAIEGDK